jgi:DNA-binding CsgD family transcriptional regulator
VCFWRRCGEKEAFTRFKSTMSETAYLILRGVPASVWAHPITDTPLRAGRLKTCEIHLAHETVSREHAEFRAEAGQYWIKDRDSRNGSFVNDKPVTEATISVGDVVRLGHVVLDIVEESAVKQATAILEHRATRVALGDAARLACESKIEQLSPTQVRVLRLLLTGMTEKEMAAKLFVSPHTVHSHIQAVYRELVVTSRAELMSMFIDRAVIEPPA